METVVSVIKELVSGQYPRELCCNAKHQLSVQDGDSIALRRLVPPEFIPDVTHTPVLADLPIIGTMFHPNGAYPELVLMLTPHIMK